MATVVAALVATTPRISAAIEYVVSPGETLGSIAPRYGVSIDALAVHNALADPNLIVAGQTLVIPDGDGEGSSAAPTARTYTVKPGDTLSVIAAAHGVSVAALAEGNALRDPHFVRSGAQLRIPVAGSAPAPASDQAASSDDDATAHVVVAGETLATIAARYRTTVGALANANGITNPHLVVEGARLKVPGAGPAATVVVGTTVAPLLDQWARTYGVPPDLLKALTWFESGWNNELISNVGAIGIGQLMPATVDFVSDYLLGERIDPHDPSDNIRGSARFLRYLLDETNWDAATAIAAYYQGLASVRRDGTYASSHFYVDGILSLRSRF